MEHLNLESKWLLYLCKYKVVTFQQLKLLSHSLY